MSEALAPWSPSRDGTGGAGGAELRRRLSAWVGWRRARSSCSSSPADQLPRAAARPARPRDRRRPTPAAREGVPARHRRGRPRHPLAGALRDAQELVRGLHRAVAGVIIGALIGLIAGATRGWVDTVLMRITDLVPRPPRAGARDRGRGRARPAPPPHADRGGRSSGGRCTRGIVRGEVRAVASPTALRRGAARRRGTGAACRCATSSPARCRGDHRRAASTSGSLILTLAGLSFLGLGAPAPAPELGAMAARGCRDPVRAPVGRPVRPRSPSSSSRWPPTSPATGCRDLLEE